MTLEAPRRTLADALALGIRFYIARLFFLSGLTKIRDWDSTLLLFEDEYAVPILSPAVAAVLGTGGELLFPVLLFVGLATPLAALGLSVVNAMAVVSYWHFLQTAEIALAQHVMWGVLLLVVLLHGGGRLSLDALICRTMRRIGANTVDATH